MRPFFMSYVRGEDRGQAALLPAVIEDYAVADAPVAEAIAVSLGKNFTFRTRWSYRKRVSRSRPTEMTLKLLDWYTFAVSSKKGPALETNTGPEPCNFN